MIPKLIPNFRQEPR